MGPAGFKLIADHQPNKWLKKNWNILSASV